MSQDHALKFFSDNGTFDLGLTFKGGTALRRYWAGNLGRFSRGRADAEWGGTPAALDTSGSMWHDFSGDQ